MKLKRYILAACLSGAVLTGLNAGAADDLERMKEESNITFKENLLTENDRPVVTGTEESGVIKTGLIKSEKTTAVQSAVPTLAVKKEEGLKAHSGDSIFSRFASSAKSALSDEGLGVALLILVLLAPPLLVKLLAIAMAGVFVGTAIILALKSDKESPSPQGWGCTGS